MNDAALDPWCLVLTTDGTTFLFGFSTRHPRTGGLGWLISTEALELDVEHGLAITRSGRRYSLGRRFEAVDVGGEGEEARLAFELLVGSSFEEEDVLKEVDRHWLMACKAARHLAVARPMRTQTGVSHFFKTHSEAYMRLRRVQRDGNRR